MSSDCEEEHFDDFEENSVDDEEIAETEEEKSHRVMNMCAYILEQSKNLYNVDILGHQKSLSILYDIVLPLVK